MEKYRFDRLGGMTYEEYRKTPEWKERQQRALKRDGYRCRVCDSNKNLDVHHRTYRNIGNEPDEDLTTLCRSCHDKFHIEQKRERLIRETYIPIQKRVSQEEVIERWEYYLLGLLILNPALCLHVCGLVSEKDFASENTKALYSLLVSTYQRDNVATWQAIELQIPVELQPAVEMAKEQAKSGSDKDKTGRVKEVVQVTLRLKRMNLLQQGKELQTRTLEAAKSGDKQLYAETVQQFQALYKQRQIIDSVSHLQG